MKKKFHTIFQGVSRAGVPFPIKKMDLYIIGKFLGTFFFILSILMMIAVVFDLAEKLEDFINFGAPVHGIIFDYYLNFVFFYSNVFSSLIIFISVIFFTSKMAKNNEIIAILSSGVSFNRMLLPFMISATILALSAIFLNHYVLPEANRKRLLFEETYGYHSVRLENIHREVEPGVIIYFNNNHLGYLDGFSMEHWKNGELKSSLFAQRAYSDTLSNSWNLQFYFIRYHLPGRDSVVKGEFLDTVFNFNTKNFGYRTEYASSMRTPELKKFIEREKIEGSPTLAILEIELHQRTAFPLAAYILTLIAVCISGRKVRGGIGVHLSIGLLLAVLYIFSQRMTTVAATNAGMDPSIAVWLPNIIFLLITIPIYRMAQK